MRLAWPSTAGFPGGEARDELATAETLARPRQLGNAIVFSKPFGMALRASLTSAAP